MEDKYKAISCGLYDELESLAVKRKKIKIKYLENNEEKEIEETISTFKTKNKEEFLILSNALEIRLDKILEIKEL